MWVSNQLANDSPNRRSGVIAWPGSATPINGHIASRYLDFDRNRSFSSSIEQIFEWFRAPVDSRINFGVIYHFKTDETGKPSGEIRSVQPWIDYLGHFFGPISSKMNETLKQCDEDIGRLLKIIDDDEFFRTNLNVIITSDHGMHDIDETHSIILEKYIDKSLFSAYGARSFANIFVKNSQ